jgi:adenylylsulfate kinase
VEIYCKCALEIAEQRDVKGLYKKARAGQIPSFTGISDPYEEPSNPEIIVDTAKETVCESLDNIWVALTERAYINVEQTEHQLVTRA